MLISKNTRHLLLLAIALSICIGIALAFVCIQQGIAPRHLLASFFIKNNAAEPPKTVAEKYFVAWESTEPEKMYTLLTAQERLVIPEKKYIEDFIEFPIRPIKHQILSSKAYGNKATIKVLVSWPGIETASEEREEKIVLFLEKNEWKVSEKESFK